DQPQKNWSPWSAAVVSTKGDRVNCPSARFVQWKATLTAATDGRSPELDGVELAYLPKNIEPRLEDLEITPSNYKFPPPVILTPSAPVSLTLPPLGRHQQPSRTASVEGSAPTMQYSKGWLGARWNASDENGDRLVYTVQIKGEQESEWKTLKDDLREKYFSFDSTAFPDGEYRVRVIASDAPSNAPPEALTTAAASEPFLIDNTPPRITELAATRTGNKLNVHWKASDALTYIEKAEYSLDGGEWTPAPPVGGLSDS
ncbi:MAG: hypothetical protein M1436_07720, partial [Acidobacteria bacterium]|nr:hypothetical protein [Acidobacteriota bacterium]